MKIPVTIKALSANTYHLVKTTATQATLGGIGGLAITSLQGLSFNSSYVVAPLVRSVTSPLLSPLENITDEIDKDKKNFFVMGLALGVDLMINILVCQKLGYNMGIGEGFFKSMLVPAATGLWVQSVITNMTKAPEDKSVKSEACV